MKKKGNNQYTKGTSGLTKKRKAYADHLIANPKDSDTEAALQTYKTKDRKTASVIAAANNKDPAVKSYLAKHSHNIERQLTDNFYRLSTSDELDEVKEGNRVGMWIHDKVEGKAVQRSITASISIEDMVDQLH